MCIRDRQNGEIYAMVNWPEFNLNEPFELPEGTTYDSEDEKQELLNQMWRNGCINDTYEPGSTFKIVTAAAAIENISNLDEKTFVCLLYTSQMYGRNICLRPAWLLWMKRIGRLRRFPLSVR